MRRFAGLLVLVLLGIIVCGSQAIAARYVTQGEVAQMINAKAEEIANVSASKAQARMMPVLTGIQDSLTLRIDGVSMKIGDISKEIDLLNQQLGVLQTGITNLQTSLQGTGGELTNMRLVNEEFQRQVESDVTKKLQIEKQRTDESLEAMRKEIGDMRAGLDKRTIWSHARTALEIGMAGLLLYHVLDHEGR